MHERGAITRIAALTRVSFALRLSSAHAALLDGRLP